MNQNVIYVGIDVDDVRYSDLSQTSMSRGRPTARLNGFWRQRVAHKSANCDSVGWIRPISRNAHQADRSRAIVGTGRRTSARATRPRHGIYRPAATRLA